MLNSSAESDHQLNDLVTAAVAMQGGRTWEAFCELFDRSCLLLLSNFLVFLLVGCGLQSLPWQTTSQKVHEDVS